MLTVISSFLNPTDTLLCPNCLPILFLLHLLTGTLSPFARSRARDEEAGEIPVAFIVRKEGSLVSEAALMDYVAKQVIILAASQLAF